MLSKNKFHKIIDVIAYVKESDGKDDDFCLYGADKNTLEIDGEYFISDYPDVCSDKEIYPEEVTNLGLSYLYSGEQFVDVVTLAIDQNPDASDSLLISALNYYQENDDFLDI